MNRETRDNFAMADYVLDITREVCPLTFVKTKLLLERGAAVDAQEMRYRISSLSHAVGRSDKALVELLLAHGADPMLKGADGRTALDRAEANGATEIVALLRKAVKK